MNRRRPSGPAAGKEPFEVLETLGWGGFAHTVKARVLDPRLAREWGTDLVAVKIPNNKEYEEVLIRELILSNFVRETLRELAEAANVVAYLGFARFRGDYVMVMEYEAGGSLMDLVGPPGEQRPLPVPRTLALARGILSGLTAIHRVGVFHRDLKPANILLDGDTPKIADLGIATMLHSQKQASTTTGTLAYMSPETLGAVGASFASDIWSVGVTLYEMLTGSWPFGDAATPLHPMMKLILESEPVPPSKRCEDVPAWLDDVVLKALDKDPAARFGDPEEMRKALVATDELGARLASVRQLLMSPEHTAAAEAALRALAKEFPDAARVHQYLGELYNRSYRDSDAIAAFQKAIELEPQNGLLHWDLALAYQRAGKDRYAAHSLRRALTSGLDASLQRHATNLLSVLQERPG